MKTLSRKLQQIDGKGYPSYKSIRGSYDADHFKLRIYQVQGDPFAAPSQLCVHVPIEKLPLQNVSKDDLLSLQRRVGYEDGILRSFSQALRQAGGDPKGSGKSGKWGVLRTGQEMLPRSACELRSEELVIRFTLGLPAAGRRVLGRVAEKLLCHELPRIVQKGIFQANPARWVQHANTYEDQIQLRATCQKRGWVAFIANGSLLPRASGIDDRPLEKNAKAWQSPPELEESIELPHAGTIQGSAIPEGVSLICGGGYHGKSTVLKALIRGVYNHIPNDGRELCVAREDAVSIQAEEGRYVENIDISGFISNLPHGTDTRHFSTENASGSTSQASNISEALEQGSRCLLIDEDSSATNFMIRDRRMQELVHKEREPITPFIDRIRELYDQQGVSSVLVIGGAGDYFEVADRVVVMENYRPSVKTQEAKAIAEKHPSERMDEEKQPFQIPRDRIPQSRSFDPSSGKKSEKVKSRDGNRVEFGRENIDLGSVTQLVDEGQARSIGDWLIQISRDWADDQKSIREICEWVDQEVRGGELSKTLPRESHDRVWTRRFELAAAINRLRSLEISRPSR